MLIKWTGAGVEPNFPIGPEAQFHQDWRHIMMAFSARPGRRLRRFGLALSLALGAGACAFLGMVAPAFAANPPYSPLPPGFSGPTVQVQPPPLSSVGAPSTDGIQGFDVPGGSVAYAPLSADTPFGVAPPAAASSASSLSTTFAPRAAAAASFACAVKGYNPYSAGGRRIASTASNKCNGGVVAYQDLGSCLQVIQPGGGYGDTKCASNDKFGPGTIYTFMQSPCSGTFNWRTRANAHAIVNGVLYVSPQVYSSKQPLLRCK